MTETFRNLTKKEQIREIHECPYAYVKYLDEQRSMAVAMLSGLQMAAAFSQAKPTNKSSLSDITAKVALEKKRYEESISVFDVPTSTYEEVVQALSRYRYIVESFTGEEKILLSGRLEGKTNKDLAPVFCISSGAVTKRLKRITENELEERIANYMEFEESQRKLLGIET